MTILRAEIRIFADDGELLTETVTIDTDDRPQPWTWLLADMISVGKKAWVRYHPGFGEATPKKGKAAQPKPWEQMELTEELSA